jgi:ribosomal RNA-processing protein 17
MLRPLAAIEDAEGHEGEDGPDEEWNGISEPTPPPIDHEAEYIDEEKYTTVTVEAMDVSKEGLFKAQQERDGQDSEKDGQAATKTNDTSTAENKKRPWTKNKPGDKDGMVQKRKKKRNFRYESKVDRKEARSRQKTKNSKQARERRAAG